VIYLATPLFTAAEQAWGADLTARMEALGCEVYYPWRDAGDAALLAAWGDDWDRINAEIARRNLRALERCDLVVAVVDGADADSGVAMEIGYAHALGTPIRLVRTDFRSQGPRVGPVNIMLGAVAPAPFTTVDALLDDLARSGAGAAGCTTAQFYDLLAEEYGDPSRHPTTARMRRAEEALTAVRVDGRRFRSALDVGCGDGAFLESVAAERKTGVDCSIEMIRRHQRRLSDAVFLIADCQHPLPLQPESFDVVHCSFVLDHLTDADAALTELARLAAPDALVLIAVLAPEPLLGQGAGEALRYRTAAGASRSVARRLGPLVGLGDRLATRWRVEDRRTVPIDGTDLAIDYYALRPPR